MTTVRVLSTSVNALGLAFENHYHNLTGTLEAVQVMNCRKQPRGPPFCDTQASPGIDGHYTMTVNSGGGRMTTSGPINH